MRRARVWSLWDMVANFSAGATAGLVSEIHVLITTARHNKEYEAAFGTDHEVGREEAVKQAKEAIDWIVKITEKLLQFMKSGHVDNAVKRLAGWGRGDGDNWDQLFTRSCALRDALKIELGEYLFYAYPKDKGQRFTAWSGDWEKVRTAFPEIAIDSYCATDCYALGHNTASVFHSMRVAEVGLRALANERRVKLPRNKAVEWGTWQEILKALDEEIRVIGQTWKAGKRKDDALEFYSGARADLNGFKDVYRNLVMHVREQYDEFQAARALTRVHEFMERLAEKLDHRHHRIKWGRS